ncbi:MAG TPA: xanthine dehydrogenase family protein molybdopterin-binding subunit [Alphaproteobacteria bacterium]
MTAGIGQPVLRKEDARLLTGRGRFSDDINIPGQAYAAMVRSPHAHARIRGIDAAAALQVPGVLAVLTGADLVADGIKPLAHAPVPGRPDIQLENRDGAPPFVTPQPMLPADTARFVGEAVAMVVAETVAAARDGAEAVAVDYAPLPAVTDGERAVQPGAPLLYPDHGSNICIDADVGDVDGTAAAFARAAHVVTFRTWVNRVTGVPMEPRAAVGEYHPKTGRYTLWAGSGGVVRQKREIAQIMGVPDDAVRVVSYDVGGNYGTRNTFYVEFALVVWAARRLGRAVKWTAERHEAFLTDWQGRDLHVDAALALDQDGNFLALRATNISNVGAYTASFVPLTKGAEIISSVYRIPVAHVRAVAALTNAIGTTPYRSAGRPEVMYVIERLIDRAARQCGFDRVALRRRNLVPPSAMPYANRLGMTYDSGKFEQAMDAALRLGDWAGYPQRRAESRGRGRHRGIAVANYIEASTGNPREWTRVTVQPDGHVDVAIGTLSSGQGHETSFAQLVTEWLGVPVERVRHIQGDTDIVPVGGGSHSGRSMRLAGIVMGEAVEIILAKGRRIAAQVLEAADADIEFADQRFTVSGTDRSVGLFEVAKIALTRADLPDDLKGPLAGESDQTVRIAGFPYGSHVCEVEVDAETGGVEIVRYAAVDDVGRAINPLILHGQSHGGIVQGLGQALLECVHYDPATGQNFTASFMDYALPRADDMPSFAVEISEVPAVTNKLGVRAGGEGGTTPTLGVLVNAIGDALAELGADHVEMPTTPHRVWETIRRAKPDRA